MRSLSHVLLALVAPAVAAAAEPRKFEVGVGALGYFGANFLSDTDDDVPVEGSNLVLPYPGFAGFSGGAGVSLEARYKGFVGLEVDLVRSSDRGSGEINGVDVTIGQTSWHMPLLLELAVPSAFVRPSVFVGIDLVFPGEGKGEADPPPDNLEVASTASSYTMLTFGFGFEVLLPIEGVDIRVPITVRGARNGGTSASASDRASVEPTGGYYEATFNSEWQWQAGGTIGVTYYFL
ncbi:MAG: outer membrane beta-barrel protein [Myxococcota bacterium]